MANFLQLALLAACVDVDHAHLFAGRDHGYVERSGDALSCAVAGAGLAGRDGGVGNEVYVRSCDSPALRRNDDRSVHLCQLGQPLWAVRGIDQESARADRQNVGFVAQDQQRSGFCPHYAVDAGAQRSARGDASERIAHLLVCPSVSILHNLILREMASHVSVECRSVSCCSGSGAGGQRAVRRLIRPLR